MWHPPFSKSLSLCFKIQLTIMKKYSLFVVMALSMAACNEKASTKEDTKETTTPAASAKVNAGPVIKDPVCGMEMEAEHWTEFSATGTDTTWFCSPHCKDQFVKNPTKYKQPAEAPKS
jgi:YHS domain-containing protein